jgi:hypothetical protein
MDDISNPQTSKDITPKEKKKMCLISTVNAFKHKPRFGNNEMRKGQEEVNTKKRRRELVPVPVCGCAMFNDFLLVYVIHYIILLLIPLFFLNYYYWRLLF